MEQEESRPPAQDDATAKPWQQEVAAPLEIDCSAGGSIPCSQGAIRHDWQLAEVLELYRSSLPDLIWYAQQAHRRHFPADRVQLSTLLNIKRGGCPEDCGYCPQSARHDSSVHAEPLLPPEEVLAAARRAREAGATRFCMGAAWRELRDRDLPRLTDLVAEVRKLGLETCLTVGMLNEHQARELARAGLDYYNHNLDTSESFYPRIISTRSYEDRLRTLEAVRAAGIRVCCGGILGLGETLEDRAELLIRLASFDPHPESVPVNVLVRVAGTPLAEHEPPDPFDVVRTIAVARVMMPASVLRLSAGRGQMSDELQALCFLAGANSVFYGEELLTTPNPDTEADRRLFARLGIRAENRG
ncbi:MAG: biotin synthase BioB [Gammaproteobacteria bacterium]|nr:MAG: biotin synthase BioB [Gammaproteobacteria bacterium]